MARQKLKTPPGMRDILPKDQYLWDYFARVAQDSASFYNFGKIDTPMMEFSELFEKGIGQGTDIVEKQMYSLRTRGRNKLTLRPEGTLSIARAYIQHGMHKWASPVKLYYIGSMFRHDKPQRGRFREFHQFGLEILGEKEPARDIEIIHITYTILSRFRLKNLAVEINSIGCKDCRPKYVKELKEHYRYRLKQVCKNCRDRYKISPLRMLDCEDEKCSRVKNEAPHMVDYLCNDCSSHFKKVLDSLDYINVPYLLNPHLVRGLDYYTKTVFEFFESEAMEEAESQKEKSKNSDAKGEVKTSISNSKDKNIGIQKQPQKRLAIASGGRYDNLVKILGGKDTPAVGVAIGIERVLDLIREQGKEPRVPQDPRIFLVQLGDLAKKRSFTLIEEFRKANIPIREALGRDSISAQLTLANKFGVDIAIIIGQKEALDKVAIIRDMKDGTQKIVPEEKIIELLKKKLR